MISSLLSSVSSVTPVTLLLVGVLLILSLAVLGIRRRPVNAFRAADYAAKRLLSNWKAKAFLDIRTALPSGYYACPQARLADMLDPRVGDLPRCRSALNRVVKKSVDFAIIDWSGRVALVIELDDRTHVRSDRRA